RIRPRPIRPGVCRPATEGGILPIPERPAPVHRQRVRDAGDASHRRDGAAGVRLGVAPGTNDPAAGVVSLAPERSRADGDAKGGLPIPSPPPTGAILFVSPPHGASGDGPGGG